jgi:hypothetical protein
LLALGCAPATVDVHPPPPALTLEATPFVPGEQATLTVQGLPPNRPAFFVLAQTEAPGRCFPNLANLCLDVDQGETYLGQARSDASGVAALSFTVPAAIPPGTQGYFQALSVYAGVGAKTAPLLVTIEDDDTYTLCDGAQEVFDANCTNCHGAGAFGGLDLRDATTIVGVQSPSVAMDWVDPAGMLDDSYLWHKIVGTHTDVGGFGSSMPPTGPLSAWDRGRVQDWVEAGGACVAADPEPPVPFAPPAAASHRLTDAQYRRAARDLFGVDYQGTLPPDFVLHGYDTVGAGVLGMSASELDTYESAAWEIAATAVGDDPSAFFGCPDGQPACVRSWLSTVTRRAWRLPANAAEIDAIAAIHEQTDDPVIAAQAVVASVLLSPRFLFHIEVATSDAQWRRFSGWERAGRLGLFLLGSVPDEGLVAAAESGALATEAGLRAEVDRLLASDQGREVLASWFRQSMDLGRLDTTEKDPSVGVLTDTLKQEMRDEYDALFEQFVFDVPQDFRGLLTTDLTMAGPELSALYDMPPGTGLRPLPDPERGGVLGRAGLLSVHAHAADTSPTRRGKFIHTRVLCRSISPPPEGVVTSLEGVDENASMRQRLEQHMGDPVCASCHNLMDPLGFAFEHYGPMGERRELDNGHPIDASGDLDGVGFTNAMQLAQVVQSHAEYSQCVVRQMYRYAVGQREPISVDSAIAALGTDWGTTNYDLRELVVSLVLDDGFTRAIPPVGGACTPDQSGDTRPCSADCGDGVETCDGLNWIGCTAPSGDWETCNGVDDDCDGQIDQDVERACTTTVGPGTQVCTDGLWEACDPGLPMPEVCNGFDDDHDGTVDEGLEVDVRTVSQDVLPGCSPGEPHSLACRAGAQALCADSACAVSGFGPVAYDAVASTVDITCMSDAVGDTFTDTWAVLAASHPSCGSTGFYDGGCNAAISRKCRGLGYVSGYGPTSYDDDGASYTCIDDGQLFFGTYTELQRFVPTCNGSAERVGADCNAAIAQACIARGFESGFGPTENTGDIAHFVCVGTSDAGPIVSEEVCNGWDDDQDGTVDEGLDIQLRTVANNQLSGCDPADPYSAACRSAARASCASSSCAITGFGPVDNDAAWGTSDLVCLGDSVSTTYTEPWSTLAAQHPPCGDETFWGGDCYAAISRHCRSIGHSSGFGPTDYDATGATFVCVDEGATLTSSYTELSSYDPVCNGLGERLGEHCNRAIHQYCKARGHVGGFGPTENYFDAAHVHCIGDADPLALPETCNGFDDDQDGDVDEDLLVERRTVLDTNLLGCDASNPGTLGCWEGANAFCQASGCASSGFGPVRYDNPARTLDVVCVDDSVTADFTETWATMAASHPNCDSDAFWPGNCYAAVSRLCRDRGYVSGFGPTTWDAAGASFSCVNDGLYVVSSYTVMSGYVDTCDGTQDRIGASCTDAISSYCEAQGYASGFGPTEHTGDVLHFVCMGAN